MPEPKKTKRTFEIQSSALENIRLVDQQAAGAAENGPAPAETTRRKRKPNPSEQEVIVKLIDFIKSI